MNNSQPSKWFSLTTGKPEPAIDNGIDLSKYSRPLARAVQEGWQIAPVSAHSKFASLERSCFAAPSNDAAQIASWAVRFPGANWCVRTGRASDLAVLEIDHETGQDEICTLCHDRWDDWTDTLKFSDDLATSFLFRYPDQRLRYLSSDFEGLQIHAGNLVLLPPAWFVAGSRLVYSNLDADVLECPGFLLEADTLTRNSGTVIRFPGNGNCPMP